MRKAYKRFMADGNRTITKQDIELAIKEIVPVYNASKEKIVAREKYAETRARFASEEAENKASTTKKSPTIKMSDLKSRKTL